MAQLVPQVLTAQLEQMAQPEAQAQQVLLVLQVWLEPLVQLDLTEQLEAQDRLVLRVLRVLG